MIAVAAPPDALIVDSLQFSQGGTAKQAQDLSAAGVKCLVGYLGAINATRIGYLHAAGIAFLPVTFGTAPDHYDGPTAAARCKALGLPAGCSVFLDVEGMAAWNTPEPDLMKRCIAWRDAVRAAGYSPCLYVGVPEPLSSAELDALGFDLYWHGQGNIVDHRGHPAAPSCGWSMNQHWPSVTIAGVLVDTNDVAPDQLGRLPVWAAPSLDLPDTVHPPVDLPSPDDDRIVQPSDLLPG